MGSNLALEKYNGYCFPVDWIRSKLKNSVEQWGKGDCLSWGCISIINLKRSILRGEFLTVSVW